MLSRIAWFGDLLPVLVVLVMMIGCFAQLVEEGCVPLSFFLRLFGFSTFSAFSSMLFALFMFPVFVVVRSR